MSGYRAGVCAVVRGAIRRRSCEGRRVGWSEVVKRWLGNARRCWSRSAGA